MEYIERGKVLEIAKDEYYSDFHKSMADLTSLRELLEDTPAADVVEVVRCKDCRFATEDIMIDGWYYCYHDCIPHKPNSFCDYGERKDGE